MQQKHIANQTDTNMKTNKLSTLVGHLTVACAMRLLLLLALPTAVQAQYDYTTNIDGTMTITRYTGLGGPVTIPSEINGLLVTGIGGSAFSSCTNLTGVSIPNSVTSIGDFAFYDCASLPSVTIPNSVTNIGVLALYSCTSLASVTIGNGVTIIGDRAFASCTSLKSVTIPDRLISIGDRAFVQCPNLMAITVEPSNPAYASVAGVLFNRSQTTLIQYPTGKAGSYTIFSSVTNIEDWAFAGCPNLTAIAVEPSNPAYASVAGVLFNRSQTTLIQYPTGKTGSYTIPNSATSIGGSAFSGCSRLTSVTVPNSVTNLGDWPFAGCTNLATITVDPSNPAYASVAGVLFNRSQTTLIQYPAAKTGGYTIPNSVTSIGARAFVECALLTSLAIPDSVAGIGEGAFGLCTRLASLTIPDNVTFIEPYTFYSCTNLASATVGNSVAIIKPRAFDGCINLKGVYFKGNAPDPSGSYDVFGPDSKPTVFYLAGTTGWNATFSDRPTALWDLDGCLNAALSPAGGTASSSGGDTGRFSVIPAGECSWSAVPNQGWLHAFSSGGSGNGTVNYYADPNPNPAFRTGSITVAGQTFTVTQGPAGFAWHNVFGWIFNAGSGWYHHNGFGWMWFSSGQWIWSGSLKGWVATMDSTSRTLWSPQFRWLTPSESDPYRADTTAIGAIYLGQYNGAAITDGWVVSGRFGYVWAAGDGMWYYTTTYGWLGVTDAGGIWCVNQGKFL